MQIAKATNQAGKIGHHPKQTGPKKRTSSTPPKKTLPPVLASATPTISTTFTTPALWRQQRLPLESELSALRRQGLIIRTRLQPIYERHLKRITTLAGRVIIQCRTDRSGRVVSTNVIEDTTGNSRFVRDIEEFLKKIKFAANSAVISIPLNFIPKQG